LLELKGKKKENSNKWVSLLIVCCWQFNSR